jgi:hypothetical protein
MQKQGVKTHKPNNFSIFGSKFVGGEVEDECSLGFVYLFYLKGI